MSQLDGHEELIAAICAEWDRAESDIKQAEQVCNSIIIPAVKELRYAGRRIVDALNLRRSGSERYQVEILLNDALLDCHRARHDAIDAATSIMAIQLELVCGKLGYDVALQCFPDFPSLFRMVQAVRAKIADSRRNRHDREKIYSTIEASDFPDLVTKYNDFKVCEPIMIAVARRSRRRQALLVVLSIAAVAVAALAWLFPRAPSP